MFLIRNLFIMTIVLIAGAALFPACGDDDDDDSKTATPDDDDATDDDDTDDDTGDDDDDDDDDDDNDDDDAFEVKLPNPGLEEVTAIEALPLLRYGTVSRQVSSHDKSGGNADGFAGFTQLYIDENGEYVIFDDYGPGCIHRIWVTAVWAWLGEMRIYIDDMETSVVDAPISSVFLGNALDNMSFPVTTFYHTSSGGCASYLPICYQQRAKIAFSFRPEFFNITYRRYDIDHPVDSFTGQEDASLLFDQWNQVGSDPKPKVESETTEDQMTVPSGQSADLLDIQGHGAVWSIKLLISPFELDAIANLRLQMWWDDQATPDVDAPVNEFFNSYFITRTRQALLVGASEQEYYCYLPMPFWSSAKISLENNGEQDVTVDSIIEVINDPYPSESGYFTTVARTESPTTAGEDYQFASVMGAGHFIGVTYTMRGPLEGSYMEGDERFYLDGALSPSIYGTGTEDYFNGGWYYLVGGFGRPLHGAPFRLVPLSLDQSTTGSYRMHVGDLMPFFVSGHFGIEHDRGNNDTNDSHSSVAYLYFRDEDLLEKTDEIDIGDEDSENDHGYAASGAQPSGILESYFEGDHDDVPHVDQGNYISSDSEFTLAISPENEGVVLRRLLDQAQGRQLAEIYVDGSYAGKWYDVFQNDILRWTHSDMVLPKSLTAGKSYIDIKIENVGGVPWSEFKYEAFSYKLPAAKEM